MHLMVDPVVAEDGVMLRQDLVDQETLLQQVQLKELMEEIILLLLVAEVVLRALLLMGQETEDQQFLVLLQDHQLQDQGVVEEQV